RPFPARSARAAQLRLGANGAEHAVAQLRRRAALYHGGGQHVGDRLKGGYFLAAASALLQMRGERRGLLLGQRAQHVRGGVLAAALVALAGILRAHPVPSAVPPSSPRAARIFASPRRIRPLTVPIGAPSISAISIWERPPKYASSITRLCSCGSCCS